MYFYNNINMNGNNTVTEEFKLGYMRALTDVFHVLMENMDNEVQDKLLTKLKLKKYE